MTIESIINEVIINGERYHIIYEQSPRQKNYWYVNTKDKVLGIVNLNPFNDNHIWIIKKYIMAAQMQYSRH